MDQETTPTETAAPPAWEAELETWFNDQRVNFAGVETELFNRLFIAKEALKQRLQAVL